mgnify:CR=1 FL=1
MTIGQIVDGGTPHPHLTIKRIPCGKGAYYRYTSGRKVAGQRVLRRIKSLAIPPNWKSVTISRDPKASIQAIGLDAKATGGKIQTFDSIRSEST